MLNTYRPENGRGAWHGVRTGLIQEQARSIQMPILQKAVGTNDYEDRFIEALAELKEEGVDTMIFGDIDPLENRRWCEYVCERTGLKSIFPLWRMDHKEIVNEFIDSGFKAIIVSVDSNVLGKDELGKEINDEFIDHLEDLKEDKPSLSVCGENGEFHSFVYDGPLFRSPVRFTLGEIVLRSGNWTVDLLPV
jgi:diphthine-ammonia ligase